MKTKELVACFNEYSRLFDEIMASEYQKKRPMVRYVLANLDDNFMKVQKGLSNCGYHGSSELKIAALNALVKYKKLCDSLKEFYVNFKISEIENLLNKNKN